MKTTKIIYVILIFTVFSTYNFAQTSPDKLLLKDYRPISIYNVPKTKVTHAKFPVIDIHSHPYANSKEELHSWIQNMNEVGIQKTILLTYAHGAQFDSLVNFYSEYKERFELWCGFDYTNIDKPNYGPEAVAELERCYKVGAKGVGELGDKGIGLMYSKPHAPGIHIDNPKLDLLIEKCGELKMPINIHIGEPQWFYKKMDSTNDGLMNAYSWRLDQQKGLNLQEVLQTLENAVAKHPNTIFIACHLANQNHDLQKLGDLLDKYPNLYADIAARYAEISPVPRSTRSFIEKYADRLFYGTDMGFEESMYEITFRILETYDEYFYEIELFNYHWPLYGLGLTDETLEKLYHINSNKLFE